VAKVALVQVAWATTTGGAAAIGGAAETKSGGVVAPEWVA